MRGPGRKSSPAAASRRATDRQAVFEAVAALKGAEEAQRFLSDLLTPAEIDAFAERWRIAQLLDEGALSYREIAAETGASTTTVARVARFLKEEPHPGYRMMIDRLRKLRVKRA